MQSKIIIVEFLMIRSNKDAMAHLSHELILQLHCIAAVWSQHRVFAHFFHKYMSNKKLEVKGRKLDSVGGFG